MTLVDPDDETVARALALSESEPGSDPARV
jgi:hypothetical protein